MAQIDNKCKPSKIINHGLTHANLVKTEQGHKLVATNAFVLAEIPVKLNSEEVIETGQISLEAVKELEKAKATFTSSQTGTAVTSKGNIKTFERNEGRAAPDTYQELFPTPGELDSHSFTINAELLYKLSQAMGTEQVTLTVIFDSVEPILVNSPDNEEVRGMIMPVKIRK